MKKTILLQILFLGISILCGAQTITISGFVEDGETGERLLNASVYLPEIKKGVVANNYGYYSITQKQGKVKLIVSYVGYQDQELEFLLSQDTVLNFKMYTANELEEVVVKSRSLQEELNSTQMGRMELNLSEIQNTPALFGEKDVIKTFQLMPGVKNTREGFSGMSVRGGNPDQNLILLDGVPVYNVSHLLGLVSVFNDNAIQSANIIKGSFPARYGGRLSSVMEINLREGNTEKLKGEAGISLVAGEFALDGPLDSKTTFCISGRRTLLDFFAVPYQWISGDDVGAYYFGDFNAKINRKFSDKSRLYLSFYYGKDKEYSKSEPQDIEINNNPYKLKTSYGYDWGNYTGSLRWNYIFSPKLFSNTTLILSDFYLGNYGEREFKSTGAGDSFGDELEYRSGIRDVGIKTDLDYYLNPAHRIRFGMGITRHYFSPGITSLVDREYAAGTGGSQQTAIADTTVGPPETALYETTAYLEDDWQVFSFLKLNLGVRMTHISSNQITETFISPRLAMNIRLMDSWSLKASYSENSQFFHLLSSSLMELPTDLWIPATENLPVETAKQWAAGTSFALNKEITLSLETYFKEMNNLLEYQEGSSLYGAKRDWEDKVETGKGWAYGGELFLQKKEGKTTGWMGYTLSWAKRKFDNINNGNTYYSNYDRRHEFSVVLNQKFSKKWDAGLNWVYYTGNPYSLPTYQVGSADFFGDRYNSGLGNYEFYDNKNNYRIPAYHRLDMALNYHKKAKKGIHHWSFSIYNVYSRKNIINMGYLYQTIYEASLYPIIPSIGYKYQF
ncbi:TonB-dependent receptor [Draconibacterium sp. IB214405]|uniref:TonB-dependent receptor n=1 Tax=Draconibacterium sp. IB214405 TaxID=3097352 RepID=UPI002A150934|nr:TonB-dependent receptor [Draconibacterium sp. IB214405]MDX8341710.1 TonB-dependent receptor [Draconibacterium sp. IB214405]